jgi:hypothetical protein
LLCRLPIFISFGFEEVVEESLIVGCGFGFGWAVVFAFVVAVFFNLVTCAAERVVSVEGGVVDRSEVGEEELMGWEG